MKIVSPVVAVLVVCLSSLSQAAPPKGWWSAQTKEYQTGVEPLEEGGSAAYIEAVVPSPQQFLALNQTVSAEDYRGKRVRLKGLIKTRDVAKWAGFWLRADNGKNKIVAFDNMQQRGVSGTTDWKDAEVVLDIPADAAKLYFGLILDGAGKAWMREVSFEVVDDTVAVTASGVPSVPRAPVNLDFKEQ